MKKIKFQYTPVQYEILCSNMEYRFKIVPKGRRLGLTIGMAFNLIDNMLDGKRTYLWGDVTLGNIRRYVDRIIAPKLRKYNISYKFNRQDFTLELGDSICDFRSADRPENWEGFGYDKIYLNEAGIILRNEYLWDNAIRMMLLDNDQSEAVIAGTPKGNRGKFPELWEISQSGNKEYWGKRFTTYDNPLLNAVEIEKIANELPRKVIRQEIYGDFVS